MAQLPIPASVFFNDFAVDVVEYRIENNGTIIANYRGLKNTDDGGDYIGFLEQDIPNIQVGFSIIDPIESDTYQIRKISYDHYQGKRELLKAYF